jgi:putative DNA primase/helicase
MNLRILQRALGGIINGGQVLAPGPGHSPRDRSLAVRPDGNGGFIVHSHAGDDWRDCRDYVSEKLGLSRWRPGDGYDQSDDGFNQGAPRKALGGGTRPPKDDHEGERTENDLARIEQAQALWNEGVDPRGTVAEKYLHARHLELDDEIALNVLRFHPRTPWYNKDILCTVLIPCLIAAFTSIDGNVVTGIHRIRLDRPALWPKTERKMLGVIGGAAVKLDPATDVLAIGEGVETCMAARQLGHRPAWALGSAGAISRFPLIEGVRELRILGETGEASREAVQTCGHRWHAAGRKVKVVMPDVGSDLNDELMATTT